MPKTHETFEDLEARVHSLESQREALRMTVNVALVYIAGMRAILSGCLAGRTFTDEAVINHLLARSTSGKGDTKGFADEVNKFVSAVAEDIQSLQPPATRQRKRAA